MIRKCLFLSSHFLHVANGNAREASHLDKLALGYFFKTYFAVSQFLEVGYLIPFALRND